MNPASLTALRDAFQRCRGMNASLKERLDSYSLAVRQIIPPYADAVEILIRRLKDSGAVRLRPVSVMLCRHLSYQARTGVWLVSNS